MAAYLVAIARIDAWTEDFQEYVDRAADLTAARGAEYIIRGAPETVCEGNLLHDRVMVVSRWPSAQVARDFWESDEYRREIKPLRDNTGVYDVGIFESA